MNDFEKIVKDYRLTTAEILYHMPDYPEFLQTFIWQEYDIAPKYPVLNKFLKFWHDNLDGKLHSVTIATQEIITPGDFKSYEAEYMIH